MNYKTHNLSLENPMNYLLIKCIGQSTEVSFLWITAIMLTLKSAHATLFTVISQCAIQQFV